ncbi:hypothetical protein [Maricaulis alexandrii]|uniref:hypothetical protein n=1 Tax=Maricaulis alexandrii TaxID=2570354 RepID=UPI0011086B39|nr:hypothetical protein [Maricaulis alexandrii]
MAIKLKKLEEFDRIRSTKRSQLESPELLASEYIPIVVPNNLSLNSNIEESLKFFNEIRHLVITNKFPIQLIFDNVEKIGSSAALVLAAEIYRCRYLRRYRNGHSVTGTYPKSESVAYILSKMGFFKSIGVYDPFVGEDTDVENLYVNYQSFTNVDSPHITRIRDDLMEAFPHFDTLAKQRMKGAIIEAISNVFDHAFRVPARFPLVGRRSWLGGVVNREMGQFTLMVYDQGGGIPGTLEPSVVERIRATGALRSRPSDGEMIEAATKIRRTSTMQSGRGKGFETMRRFVDASDDGELRVFSNSGRYLYSEHKDTISADATDSLWGTLILWRVRHQGAQLVA